MAENYKRLVEKCGFKREHSFSEKLKESLDVFQNETKKVYEPLEIQKALKWFKEEVAELEESIEEKDKDGQIEELAQCFIWCASIANSLNLDVSEIVHFAMTKHLNKYPEYYDKNKSK